MKPRGALPGGWFDTGASLMIGLGLGYLLLRGLEMAAVVAWALCGLGAVAKMIAAWMASRPSDTGDS